MRKRHFIILDFENEPLRTFYTKVDAEWFVKDKPDCSIKTITVEEKDNSSLSFDEFTAKYGEPLF